MTLKLCLSDYFNYLVDMSWLEEQQPTHRNVFEIVFPIYLFYTSLCGFFSISFGKKKKKKKDNLLFEK